MGLNVVQPNRIDASDKSKVWDFSKATTLVDEPILDSEAATKKYVDDAVSGVVVEETDPVFTSWLSTPPDISTFNNDSGYISDLSGFTTDDLTEGSVNFYDKQVSLTPGTNVTITGTYPDFTISSSGGVAANNWGDIYGNIADQLDLQEAFEDFVPYSGATGNVDLGEYNLINYVKMTWDDDLGAYLTS